MIAYKSLDEFSEYDKLRECWNEEFGLIYPIQKAMFQNNAVTDQNLLKKGSFVALYDNEVAGFIIGKTWNDPFNIPVYNNIGWISLIFVKRKFRNQGIGSFLINKLEEEFKNLGKQKIVLGRDTFNFFPGLPADMINHRKWFINRGYAVTGEDYDMIRYFQKSKEPLPIPETNYEVKLADLSHKEELLAFFERNFKGRWEYEAKNYFLNNGTGREFMIVLDGKKVIAFARINDKNSKQILYNINWSDRFVNLAGIGPLGVDAQYRKQKLGYIVTAAAVNEVQKRGCTECIIDWTGLVDFYHLFKFEVWKGYTKLEKII